MMFKRKLFYLFNRTFRRKQVDLHIKRMSVDVEKSTAEIHMNHPIFVEFISSCTEIFDSSGAIKFLEMKFFDVATMREFEVTIKPSYGRLSSNLIIYRLRYALERIQKGDGDPRKWDNRAVGNVTHTEPLTEDAVQWLRQQFGWTEIDA